MIVLSVSLVPRLSASSALLTFELARKKSFFLASEFKVQALVCKGGSPGMRLSLTCYRPYLAHTEYICCTRIHQGLFAVHSY